MKYKFVYLKYLNVVTVYIYDIPVVKVLDPVPRTFDPSFQIQGKERKFTPCLHYIYSIYIIIYIYIHIHTYIYIYIMIIHIYIYI